MNYPKFTRAESRGCKLTDEQITQIKERRKNGEWYKDIALSYGISAQAVYYWCLTDEQRKQQNIKKNPRVNNDPVYQQEFRARKLALHPELRIYEKQTKELFRLENPEKSREIDHKSSRVYRNKNLEKLRLKNRLYQQSHLDKYREYNKKCRAKKI